MSKLIRIMIMKLSTRLPGLSVQFDSDSCPYLSPIANMKTISFWTISFNDISNWPCIIENIHVLSTKDGPCGLCCVAATSLSCEIRSFFVWQGGGPASPPPTPIYIQIEIQIEFFSSCNRQCSHRPLSSHIAGSKIRRFAEMKL